MSGRRFSGQDWVDVLSREKRDLICSMALELVVAWHAEEHAGARGDENTVRAAQAADHHILDLLRIAVDRALPAAALEPEPPLPSLLGPVCRSCGCTNFDPCPDGCGWASTDQCTRCADAARVKEACHA